jgi:hypothetical protein
LNGPTGVWMVKTMNITKHDREFEYMRQSKSDMLQP